ncbi:unnamed protein product [Cylicocyclus nassatus]|uniref:Flagellin C-terminal domain-containing protein n=1 Tax=Cylicocyclus nassatus TaxID=53992 RepID=A0AA36GQL3_CYLNA|nr:unnamed protein product [Cylicocyclus nassatus]
MDAQILLRTYWGKCLWIRNKSLSGGADASGHYAVTGGHWVYKVPGDEDSKVWIEDKSWVEDSPAKKATLTVTGVSSVASGTGITIKGYGSNTYVKFVDGDAGPSPTYSDSGAGSDQYYTVGKNYTGTWNRNGMTITFADGNMTMTANSTGTYANGYGISDGFATVPAKPEIPGTPGTPGTPTTVVYTGTTPLGASNIVNEQKGKNGETAHWDLDLSAYNVSDEEKANELIKAYVGKTLQHGGNLTNFEFIDSGSSNTMDKETKQSSSTPIDLAVVRTAVKGGATVSEAFSTLLNSRMSSFSQLIKNGADEVTGLQINASVSGAAGNNQRMTTADGELRHYTIDFKSWTDGKTNIPAELNEKGFRFYCATDAEQWVNVMFVNGFDGMDKDKPASGTATQDIKTVLIDISGVTDAKSLVEVIDKDLGDYLKNVYKHNFLLASDTEAGTVTIYDKRRYTVLDKGYLGTREKGAKIADGVLDNVVKDYRYLYANRLIIHHTDESSNNIKIDIPQTSMDQIYGYKKENYEPEHFNVLTKEMRERLLGWDSPGEKGIIDKGIEYLTDAQTLIGSQINHMEFADANITTMAENTTAAESVIRDSDMAKEYCEFSKASILTQTAQSMLAQSNQNAGRAVELLQGV